MNIPNLLTAARFLLIPVFAYNLYDDRYITAAILFTVAGLTDILDGYIARKYNKVTAWGKIADPAADKLMQITALVLLTLKHLKYLPILIIVAVKELFMGIGSLFLYKKDNYVVSANWYGKMATVIFYFAIIMIIFKVEYSEIFILLALAATLFAFFMYLISFKKIRKLDK